MAVSTAISLDRVSAIVGYEINATLAGIKAGNLPQRIAILGEARTENQVGLPAELSFTTAKEVGEIYGYGSPAYLMARILRPISGDVLGGIPTVVYPVLEAAVPTASIITYGITGQATKSVSHRVILSGRDQLDGTSYVFTVEKDDQAAEISQKIADVINNVLGAPAVGSVVADDVLFTSKWKGITSAEMKVTIDTGGNPAGITYSEDANVPGTGVGSPAAALASFGDNWNTIVVNGIGTDTTILDALEDFNGTASEKDGRYLPTTFKPFVALVGSVASTLAAMTALTDTRKNEMTNVICPAPNSDGFTFEAAANMALIYAKIAQDTPQTDPYTRLYSDMPTADDIGDFADPSKRDQIVKVGSSTVKINSGKYEMIDFVTTSHPEDEPQTAVLFRWVRDIVGVDWNVKFKYALLESIFVTSKTIIKDNAVVSAVNTISPKRWRSILSSDLVPQLVDEGLSADAKFMADSIQVAIGTSNPNRFETSFDMKRTGTARVQPTTNNTQFNFGG